MSIPLHMRIQIRQFLTSVKTLTDQINDIHEKIRTGQKGVVTLTVGEYVLLMEEVRRVEYIMLGIAVSGLGVSLRMPDRSIPASDFRIELDNSIALQLQELEDDGPRIILTDSLNGNGK